MATRTSDGSPPAQTRAANWLGSPAPRSAPPRYRCKKRARLRLAGLSESVAGGGQWRAGARSARWACSARGPQGHGHAESAPSAEGAFVGAGRPRPGM